MWCEKCQADVAGIASPDNERAFCTSCGNELARSVSACPAPTDSEQTLRDPRELLARWAREDALNPLEIGSFLPRDPAADKRKAAMRFDGAHAVQPAASAALLENVPRPDPRAAAPPTTEPPPSGAQDVVIHRAHPPNPPHFTAVPVTLADSSTRWVTLAGQIFAYIGVGGLTVGTALILMGYFGGPASYATTGWLVATAGQMLLFLGVVTLVSGGMEQTTQEVARRIDTLGERLGRIEQAAAQGQTPPAPERVESR